MFTGISTNASNISNTVNDAQHKETIQKYINKIRILQRQIFFLNEYNLEISPTNKDLYLNSINFANNEIENLRKKILNYLKTIPNINSRGRDLSLILNSLNSLKSALYQLILLGDATSAVEKNLLLEDFYLFIRFTAATLNSLENIIIRE